MGPYYLYIYVYIYINGVEVPPVTVAEMKVLVEIAH